MWHTMNFSNLINIDPFNWPSIGTALLCGFIIGFERQIRGKPVGIRTSSLIALGTYIFVATSLSVSNNMTDPSRIIGQVVTGIGFLGAGVMLARGGVVVGVTSAATIWALASIGVSIAIGYLGVAIKLSVIVVLVLAGIDLLEGSIQALTKGAHSKYRGWRDKTDNSDQL